MILSLNNLVNFILIKETECTVIIIRTKCSSSLLKSTLKIQIVQLALLNICKERMPEPYASSEKGDQAEIPSALRHLLVVST